MFWLGCCLIIAAVAAAAWRVVAVRHWLVTDALIVDHREVISSNGHARFQPVVQITDIDNRQFIVRLHNTVYTRQGGTVVVRYPPGEPTRARAYHALIESLLIHLGIALAGILMIATSNKP